MMFTTQQILGGPKYSHKTRIGNWQEEMELEEIKKIDYDQKKNGSQLNFHKTLSTTQQQIKKVPWSHSRDGFLKSGFQVLITNKKTQGYMVADIGTRTASLEESYQCTTTTQHPGPITRSIFQITKAEKVDIFGSDDIIRYGQKIKIQTNPYLFRRSLWLSSQPLGPNVYSPVTRNQEASLSVTESYNGTWVIDYMDPNYRFEKQGEPVEANAPILIRHCSTSHYLAADLNKIKNDFGQEYEVCVNSFATKNRSQNLALEKEGKITGDIPSKFQEDQNVFYFITAPSAAYAQPIEELNRFTIDDLIREIKTKIVERSANGIRGIAKIFKAMDENGSKTLDVDDFRWGLKDYGITISKEESQQVMQHFDRDGNGSVDFNEFLRALKGDLNATRKRYIKMAYDKLDVNKDGLVKLDDIAKIYDASKHPDVLQGKKSHDQVFLEFMSQWDTQTKDGIVTFEEFCDYYSDVSASIESDDYFAEMMISAWKFA
eukprot:403333558